MAGTAHRHDDHAKKAKGEPPQKGGLPQEETGGPGSADKRRNQVKDGQRKQGLEGADAESSAVGSPTRYTDPTTATDPPGGKVHHVESDDEPVNGTRKTAKSKR